MNHRILTIFFTIFAMLGTNQVLGQVIDMSGFDPIFTLENGSMQIKESRQHVYRSMIPYDDWPEETAIFNELQKSDFQKLKVVRVEEPGFYVSLLIIDSLDNRPRQIISHAQWKIDNRIYKLNATDRTLTAIPDFGLIGTNHIFHIDPGRNVFIAAVNNQYRGAFKVAWLDYFDPSTYLVEVVETQSLLLIFAGIVLLNVAFSVWLILIFKKVYLLYYLVYLGSISYLTASWNGMIFDADLALTGIMLSSSAISLVLFLTSFLKFQDRRTFLSFQFLLALQVLAAGISFIYKGVAFSGVALCLAYGFFLWYSFKAFLNRLPYVGFLFVGAFFAALCAVIRSIEFYFNLNIMNVHNLLILGLLVEILCFSFGMLLKSRFSEIKALKSSEHAFNQLQKVFYPHQIQQIRGGAPLELTMPTHDSEAVVLSFDVIASSQIRHPKVKNFLEVVFSRCYDRMAQNYDGNHLQADGYRIKQLGDGFLCSVGYPFACPEQSIYESSLALAADFITIFHEEVRNLQYHRQIHCSVGMASGSIRGFYPQSGAQEYDLFGDAIILATRYESMRKELMDKNESCDIIVVQDKVYLALSEHQKTGFVCRDIESEHLTVRDDPDARFIAFKKIPSGAKMPGSQAS